MSNTRKTNKKIGISAKEGFKLRIWHKKARGRQSARYLVKCGDCDNQLEIYYGDDAFVEINGVNASKEEWSSLFNGLLKIKL